MHGSGARATVGLFFAIISVGLTAWAVFGRVEPLGIPFDAPEKVKYYRWTIALILLAGASAASAVVLGMQAKQRALNARWVGVGVSLVGVGVSLVGGGGLAVAGFFLLILIGLCGPAVLWGHCQP
jgi:hypothetical protein